MAGRTVGAAALRKHPELAGELSWHRSAIANFLGSIELFDRQTRLVMSDLEKLRV